MPQISVPVSFPFWVVMHTYPSGTSAPYASEAIGTPEPEVSPLFIFEDKLSWTKGTHSLSFGASITRNGDWTQFSTVVPSLSFGVDTTYDPARIMFDATNGSKNFPGASSSQISEAAGIYASLTGRVTAVTGSAVLNENTLQYSYNGNNVTREHQSEIGLFLTDSWRMIPTLTLNYGLRYELQLPFTPGNAVLSYASTANVWGPSGVGNLFKPGSTGGQPVQVTQFLKGDRSLQPLPQSPRSESRLCLESKCGGGLAPAHRGQQRTDSAPRRFLNGLQPL